MREPSEQPLPEVFEDIRDPSETIYWVGKPNAFCFMFSGIPFLIVGCLWGLFDLFFLSLTPILKGFSGFLIPFFLLHSFPFWGSLLYMAWLWLARYRTFYAFSNRRLMVRSGAIGTYTKTFDYDGISNLEVTVGPIEKMLGVGSIRFNTGRTDARGGLIPGCFKAIREPYEVFKRIKETTMDIKTDENYPNALRTAENPGYHTKYKPGNK
jgi:hypothetical protein